MTTLFEELGWCKNLVDLKICGIDLYRYEYTEAFELLLNFLSENKVLECFYFSNNHLSPPKILSILNPLLEIPKLVDFGVTGQKLDKRCIEALANGLIDNKSIRYLNLSNCHLTDALAKILITPISESLNLKLITLDSNKLSDSFLSDFCSTLKPLTEDDFKAKLQENFMITQDEEFTLRAGSEDQKVNDADKVGLVGLSLANNRITDFGAEHLC